jgi:hypothetical protein
MKEVDDELEREDRGEPPADRGQAGRDARHARLLHHVAEQQDAEHE